MARVIAVTTALVVLLACAGAVAAVGKDDWKLSGIPTPNSLVKVTIGLRHPEGTYAALVGTCKSVSEPTSEAYGQYLSLEEVAAMSQSDENVALVSDFLHSFGVADLSVSPTRDSLVAVMPVRVANEAFGVDMRVFTHVDVEKARIVRSATAPTQLPARVSAAIEVIVGVSDFPTLMRSLVAEHRRRAGLAARVAAETERRASAAASTSTTGTGNAPSAPTPGLQYVSDTQTTLMVIQRCGGSISSTPQPCTGTDYPITGYEALLYVNGKEVESALPVPLSSVSAEIQPGPQANMTVYNVAVPYKLTEFQYVNVSIRAVNDYGKSEFVTIPWVDQYSMTDAYHRMLATPYVTPEVLTNFYGLPPMPSVPTGVTQAVAEFGYQWYSPVDLANFYKMYNLPSTPVTVVGNNDGPQSGGEATLDIEYITAVSPGVPTTFWSVTPGSEPSDSAFLFEWAVQMNAASNPPLITSISYGLGEDQFASSGFGDDYISRCNAEYLKLCARGVGIVTAAGDAGASNDGHGSNSCAVQPDFPSSSPWVTTVSASFISNEAPVNRPGQDVGEVAVSIPNGMFWTTGGGFSSMAINEQPWYQKDFVEMYLQRAAGTFPPTSIFNSTLRAYPDVSAIGHNLMCQWAGTLVSTDGTSASSPIFAAMLTRLNAARMSVGKSQIGFANPMLYNIAANVPGAFYDITVGDNKCAGFTCCEYGYSCATGFDAVSGLGSVGKWEVLEAAVLAL